MWKNNTNLIIWGVEQMDVESTVNYIKTQYDSEKASFLLSRMIPVDQIMLERQLLTIAHAHTNDRANAYVENIIEVYLLIFVRMLVGSLVISDLLLDVNRTFVANATIGQREYYRKDIRFCTAASLIFLSMVVSAALQVFFS
jgi:hypothetical protein